MIDHYFEIEKRFKQREETINLAIDLMDRYFMQPALAFDFKDKRN